MLRYNRLLPKMLLEWHNTGIILATFEILVFQSRKTSIIEGLVWILQTFGGRSAAYIYQLLLTFELVPAPDMINVIIKLRQIMFCFLWKTIY